MAEHNAQEEERASETTLQLLRGVRRGLLRLHKILLDGERARYEQARGQISSGELLQLVINHEQFAWLRAFSELIVRIDEFLDVKTESPAREADELISLTRQLLTPAEEGEGSARKYFLALQREPEAVLAHREMKRLLEEAK